MSEYNPQRRVTKAPAVERVSQFDTTAKLDLDRQKRFEAALSKAADSLRLEDQRKHHHSYADVEARSPKKK